jgi:hypothetical protein
MYSKSEFQKVKLEHHILPDFAKLLLEIEKDSKIIRIIPWRISRQQKWSSEMRFRVTIPTKSGFKCIMSKWSTAQELFVICNEKDIQYVKDNIENCVSKFLWK